jgi:hypothetical protein
VSGSERQMEDGRDLDKAFFRLEEKTVLAVLEHGGLLESTRDQTDVASRGEDLFHRLWSTRKTTRPAKERRGGGAESLTEEE